MAFGLSARLPLALDPDNGLRLNIDYTSLVRQNLKNLILTIPGERIMDPSFGVGLKTFLFEADVVATRTLIESKIKSQVARYLPYVEIQDIQIESALTNNTIEFNFLFVKLTYFIRTLSLKDYLDIRVADNARVSF